MITSLAQATALHNNWRATELAVGILGNMACHASLRTKFLEDSTLANLICNDILSAEDANVAGEACRLCATLLTISQVRQFYFFNS